MCNNINSFYGKQRPLLLAAKIKPNWCVAEMILFTFFDWFRKSKRLKVVMTQVKNTCASWGLK